MHDLQDYSKRARCNVVTSKVQSVATRAKKSTPKGAVGLQVLDGIQDAVDAIDCLSTDAPTGVGLRVL